MMMQESGGGDPQEIFEQSFQELAFAQLVSKAPEIVDSVVSFKVQEADPSTNHAVGAFIVERGGEEVHVPAIFADNEMMPFDTMYVKSLDQMLPLNEQWLTEVEHVGEQQMGESMKAPETLSSDVDIRNIVVPPTTGRYSYASVNQHTNLPAYLWEASNPVKVAFVRTLENNPHIAKFAFDVYGVNALRDAVTLRALPQVKEAAPTVSFMTMETPAEEIKEKAKEDSSNVFRTIAEQGYAAWDERPELDMAVMYETETPLQLTIPSDTGYYRIYRTDGRTQIALIFGKVLTENTLRYGKGLTGKTEYDDRSKRSYVCRAGLTEDGELFVLKDDFVAEPVGPQEVPEKLWKLVTKPTSEKPKNNQKGIFYNPDPGNLIALEPMAVERTWSTDGSHYAAGQVYSGNQVTVQQIEGAPGVVPRLLIGERTSSGSPHTNYVPYAFADKKDRGDRIDSATLILVPDQWAFLPVKETISGDEIIRDAGDVVNSHFHKLAEAGADIIRLQDAGAGFLYTDGAERDKLATVKHLVFEYNVAVPDAEEAVKTARDKGLAQFYVLQRTKTAQPAGPPPGGAPPGGAPMDPAMVDPAMVDPAMMDPAMMDPAMMGGMPPMPPPPNVVEMAAQEVADQLAEQNQLIMSQMAQQAQSIQTQMAAIQAVVGRANELSMQTGLPAPEVMAPPIEPMNPAMMGGAAPDMASMDPAGSQMMAERGGMYPGEMPPEGMEPGMGPGMEPGMGPGGAPPVGPDGMPVEEPGMMEAAMELEDPDMFDAAAIASLAESNNFDSTVSGFLPAVRESLDALGRMLTEVRMKAPILRERIGDGTYNEIRDKLQSLFEGMGDTILRINAIVASDENVDAPS